MNLPSPITSRSNARVKALRAASGGDAAEPGELLAIEGENLIGEAIRSGVRFDTVFVREGNEDVLLRVSLAGLEAANWVVLSKDVFASAVDTASPQGIAALIAIPELAAMDFRDDPSIVLVIESLQDPGNLGTLLRSAEAFAVKQVFVTSDTVNRWNPKAVRASAGSVFRVPVVRAPLAATKEFLAGFGCKLFAAVAQSQDAMPVMEASLLAPCALLVGNEGAGLSAAALALADARVHIPCAVESLNAAIAGSTLMYEALRQNLARRAEGTA
ncbi:MAG TPA: RNA methyltransferase [Acidobacteriaceae bacterium]|nr:RNA methyltransferase [Acidobacteriaceae bacterium]